MTSILEVRTISKSYTQGDEIIHILKDVSFSVEKGETVAIMGPSGSGKSTLLSIMSGLDTPDSGTVLVEGQNIATLTEEALSTFRNKKISTVFQSFELVQFFNALENVSLPLTLRGDSHGDTKGKEMLKKLNLSHRINNLPKELSGGEQQRVAIGRALIGGADIIFADEPTGNLDSKNGQAVLDMFLDLVKEENKTLIIITHDSSIAERMDTQYELRDMNIIKKEKKLSSHIS
ncbi:MAG: hypothetical protein RI935_134 [Candidatus Parcubacteria bacterium]|jgi:putative ABC transport system ATP-binding protein